MKYFMTGIFLPVQEHFITEVVVKFLGRYVCPPVVSRRGGVDLVENFLVAVPSFQVNIFS